MNKEKLVELCGFGTHLWRIVYPYKETPRVIEVEIINIRTFGTDHTLQVEVKPISESEPNWMYYNWANYDDLFKSKEEAEKGLETMFLSWEVKNNG